MKDVYAVLGLFPGLSISDDKIRKAYLEASKRQHPDAGGREGDFANLRAAHAILSSPSQRLRTWLEHQGVVVDTRGPIDPLLMDLFTEIGTILQNAGHIIRKREEARSALSRALLENETQACRDAVEESIASVDANIRSITAGFVSFEHLDADELPDLSVVVRNLAFLEKWRANLRECFARLV